VTATVEIIGVRHHSPACARLVEARLRALRPQWVLIEGPSDFNNRIAELQNSEHQPPIAIFSWYGDASHTCHSFAPFADFSPEWIALQVAAELGANTRFIDLPYWHEGSRDRGERYVDLLACDRQRERERALAQRLGFDGGDALWDHLFEQSLPLDQLAERLAVYFDQLRCDEPGDASDRAREAYMAQWIARIAANGQRVLVICGGWHRRPLLESLQQSIDATASLEMSPPEAISRHGSFLIPYSDRRLEALAGYQAGVQSPGYYRWLYTDGADIAAERASEAIIRRLRNARQTLSTAALIAAATRTRLLAALRGHPQPLRVDLLDGLLDALSNEALSAPPPWNARNTLSMRDDPNLREALLALTGDRVGRLAPGTPLPPLVFDVEALLDKQELNGSRTLQLDRSQPADCARSQTLWRLQILGIPGIEHQGNSAPQAARQLQPDQQPQEQWSLQASDARHTALIEAGAHGPTLQAAALHVLGERLAAATDVDALAALYASAVRAGYRAFGDALLPDLHAALAACSDHGALGRAGLRLLALTAIPQPPGHGDAHALLQPAMSALLARLLWLLEGLASPQQSAHAGDVDALRLLDRLLDPLAIFQIDRVASHATLARIAANPEAPPSLRGACFGVLWRHPSDSDPETELLAAARAFAHGEALGDFLYGLFALARNECVRSQGLIGALDAAFAAMSDHQFLLAAAALRQAFHYFPPRERAELGQVVGRLHGLDGHPTPDWLQLSHSIDDLQRSARLLSAIAETRTRIGL
jgi:hypothetical protein